MNRLDKYKPLLLIAVLFAINLVLFYGKTINLHTDFGREILFSKMVSQGAVLYRDIFNTFVCPFSYLFNGLVLKFAPVNINTFYALGAMNTAIILACLYFISRKFLNRAVSCVITIFVMYYCCFYAGLMNFLTPYSYAIVYGLGACLASVLLYLNYLESDRKGFLYAAFFFGGLSAACKYEFFAYALLLCMFLFFKKENFKTMLTACVCFCVIPAACAAALAISGLTFADVKNYLSVLQRFVQQPYLDKVYALTCKLSFASLIAAGKTFVFAAVLFCALYLPETCMKFLKPLKRLIWAALVCGVLFSFGVMEYFSYSFFGFLTYLVAVFALVKIKSCYEHLLPVPNCRNILHLSNDNLFSKPVRHTLPKKRLSIVSERKSEPSEKINYHYSLSYNFGVRNLQTLFLVLAALSVSLKSFWFLSTNFYGRYFLPLLIVAAVAAVCQNPPALEIPPVCTAERAQALCYTVCAILVFLSFAAFRLNLVSLVLKKHTLKTPCGTVKMTAGEYAVLKPLTDFVTHNTQKNDKIVVLGQAPILNFLTDRPSVPFYSHFDEAIAGAITFENIINAYNVEKPEYIVIFEGADKSSSYCAAYGKDVCDWVFENYKIAQKINPSKDNDTVYVFQKRPETASLAEVVHGDTI